MGSEEKETNNHNHRLIYNNKLKDTAVFANKKIPELWKLEFLIFFLEKPNGYHSIGKLINFYWWQKFVKKQMVETNWQTLFIFNW